MGQPVLSLIEIYGLNSLNGQMIQIEKNTACDENREKTRAFKRLELFVETYMKYFKGLYDLKLIV